MKRKITMAALATGAVLAGTVAPAANNASAESTRPVTSTTNSTKSSFSFAAAGDFGKANAGSTAAGVFAAAKKANVDFFDAMGDLSYSPPSSYSEKQWCTDVKAQFTNPVVLLSGNHESGNQQKNNGLIDNFVKSDCIPNRMKVTTSSASNTTDPTPANYGKEFYYDYGQQTGTDKPLARMIQTSAGLDFTNGGKFEYKKGNAHYQWLSNAIDDAHAKGIKWIIVTNHTNYITVGSHVDEVGSDFYNLLIDKKVDLLLNGHDHTYQRSKQFAHTAGCSVMPSVKPNTNCIVNDGADGHYTKGKGLMQVISGTGGGGFHQANPADTEWPYMSKVMGNDYQTHGFLKINVDQDAIKGNFVNTQGSFTDSFSIDNGSTPPPTKPSGSEKAFTASEDTWVDSTAPTHNGGKDASLQTDGSPTKRSYLRFKTSGLSGKTIKSVKMRLFVTDPSKNSQNIVKTTSSWSEATTTYNNRPGSSSTTSATITNTPKGWIDVNLPVSDIKGDGTYDYGIHPKAGADGDGIDFGSRESANKPQLIVTTN